MKKVKKALLIMLLMVIVGTVTFFIGRKIGLNTDTSYENTKIEEVTVGTQSIKKTLTSSGEIKTSNIEKIELSTSKYFETMCVEDDDIVKKGENILKYTNGTYLTAPYDLVISSHSVPETKTKAKDTHYVEVQNLEELIVNLSINENEISNVSLEQEVEIVLTADSNKKYTGKIAKISQVGTYATSGTTFPVEVSLTNDGDIKIGMSVSCIINIKELKDVTAVPIDSVQINGDRRYVIAVENGDKKEVDVTTGIANDKYVQILSGLNGGEIIQVLTTTKQNNIRSGNSSSSDRTSGFGKGSMNFEGMPNPNFGGGIPNFEGGNMGAAPGNFSGSRKNGQ